MILKSFSRCSRWPFASVVYVRLSSRRSLCGPQKSPTSACIIYAISYEKTYLLLSDPFLDGKGLEVES